MWRESVIGRAAGGPDFWAGAFDPAKQENKTGFQLGLDDIYPG